MRITVKCPSCLAESTMSLRDRSYQGPYRCWKCKSLFSIVIEGSEVKSCQPLSAEEFQRIQTRRSY